MPLLSASPASVTTHDLWLAQWRTRSTQYRAQIDNFDIGPRFAQRRLPFDDPDVALPVQQNFPFLKLPQEVQAIVVSHVTLATRLHLRALNRTMQELVNRTMKSVEIFGKEGFKVIRSTKWTALAERVSIRRCNGVDFHALPARVKHVELLEFVSKATAEDLRRLLPPTITSLSINFASIEDQQPILHILQDYPLTTLHLAHLDSVSESTAKSLRRCTTLTDVWLSHVNNNATQTLGKVLQHLPHVTALNIYECGNVSSTSFAGVFSNPSLTSLSLSFLRDSNTLIKPPLLSAIAANGSMRSLCISHARLHFVLRITLKPFLQKMSTDVMVRLTSSCIVRLGQTTHRDFRFDEAFSF